MDVVGRYRILDVLGDGPSGILYRAHDPVLDREVAVRFFLHEESLGLGEQHLARFTAHPGILDIHDAGLHDGRPYHVLEYIDGRSIGELIRAGVHIAADAALSMAEATAGALRFMHERGFQHNDVTPENVVVRSSGEPVLVDFRHAGPLRHGGARDILGLARTLTMTLTEDLDDPDLCRPDLAQPDVVRLDLDALSTVAPPFVVDLVRRCQEGRFVDIDALRCSLHAVVEAFEDHQGAETRRRFMPCEGDTVLLHADNYEAESPGSFREYHIEGHLSAGGFGEVYRAIDRVSGQRVALKVLKRHLLTDADAVARFRREADVLAYLQHPNIVRIFNYGRYGATAFIAMELIEGPTLWQVHQGDSPMALSRASSYVRPILRALDVLSGRGIVHRDVKPNNIKVARDRVVLLDFGIAQVEGWETLTQDAAFIGTVRYASPEQLSGGKLSPASDIYAAGVVLYELLTGAPPHAVTDPTALMVRIATAPADPVENHRPDLSRRISGLIGDMLALDPRDRPTAAEALGVMGDEGDAS